MNKALDMLSMIRKKQQDKINLGSDYVNLYFEDVEGDWLETWGDNEKNSVPDEEYESLKQKIVLPVYS